MGQANIEVLYPFGVVAEKSMTATGAQNFTIANTMTLIDGITVEATADRTINITLDANLRKGSRLVIFSKTAGTQALIFGTNITGVSITGVAGKTFSVEFEFDGVEFKQLGAEEQID